MNEFSIEYENDIDALHIRIGGHCTSDWFLDCYRSVLNHPHFRPGIDLLWDASQLIIEHYNLADLKLIYNEVKQTESVRKDGLSAWVLSNNRNYYVACMCKAAFGSTIAMTYEIFTNVVEAKDWLIDTRRERGQSRASL